MRRHWIMCMVVLLGLLAPTGHAADQPVSFRREIAPLLVEQCLGCHNAETTEGAFDITRFEGLFKTAKGKSMIVPGKVDQSKILGLLDGSAEPAMPMDADPLDKKSVALISRWIKEGAKFDGPDRQATLESLIPKTEMPINKNYTIPPVINGLAFSPDKKQLAASGFHEITLWNPANGQLLKRLETKGEKIQALAFTSDGKYLVHAGGTPARLGEVVLWNVQTGQPVKTLHQGKDMLYGLAVSSKGDMVAAGGADRTLHVWKIPSGDQVVSQEIHADWILGVSFQPDGKRVFTASRDKTVKIWDLAKKQTVASFARHTDGTHQVRVLPNGKSAVSASDDRFLRVWNTNDSAGQIRAIRAHTDSIFALALSNDGTKIFSSGADQWVRIWDARNGRRLNQMKGPKDWVHALAVSHDGQWLASGDARGEIWLWNVKDGKRVRHFLAVPAVAQAKKKAGDPQAISNKPANDKKSKPSSK